MGEGLTSAAETLGVSGTDSPSAPAPAPRLISSQTCANSRPRTKEGSAMRRRPQMRSGTVRRRPRKERGVISP